MMRGLGLGRTGRFAGTVAATLLLLAACSKPAETPAGAPMGGTEGTSATTTAATKTIKIGMIAKSETNDVFQAAKSGAMDAAKELGPKYGVNVEIDWRTPSNEDVAKQVDFLNAMVNEKDDAVLLSCSEARTLTPAINEAVEKGVTVACYDSDAPDSKRLFDYGTDDAELGRIVVQQLARVMGEKGTVAFLDGNQSAPNLQMRLKGAREELAKYPNMQELNNGNGVFYHEETPEKAAEQVNSATAANPGKIDGWGFLGGWPLFTDGALNIPENIKVVSADALPKQLDYLRSGKVQVLINQDCYGWGYKGVEYLLDYLVKGQKPPSEKIANPLTIVTKDGTEPNTVAVDEFQKYWDKWLKKG